MSDQGHHIRTRDDGFACTCGDLFPVPANATDDQIKGAARAAYVHVAAAIPERRCASCGVYGGHETDCRTLRFAVEDALRASCDHKGTAMKREIGDPPGPWCCGRCGLELPPGTIGSTP